MRNILFTSLIRVIWLVLNSDFRGSLTVTKI